ncbi:hypothetical protein ONZ45_g6660 [Pleurotus djamor]|nr:hypothetical protein ONZ45_g6660 [Pleurotus djamor]
MPVSWANARRFVWGETPSSRTERILLLKIDWFILSYCCLMSAQYFTNYNLILQVVRPRIWLPTMQLVWGVLTFCTSAVSNVQQIYGIRFIQGMAESSTFAGTHYILGSWYKPSELGKRSGIFTSSGLVGTLCAASRRAKFSLLTSGNRFSGVLQAAVYRHLNGLAGRSGWRWLFIIDGIITLPIALYGYAIFPDVPAITSAFYLNEEERHLAVKRLRGSGSDQLEKPRSSPFSWAVASRVLTRWRWYGCSLLFALSGETESFGSNNLMGQYLKAHPTESFTVEQIDYYPTGATAFAIFSTLVCATWTDVTTMRWPVLVYMCICVIISSICILVWGTPTGVKFFAYYLAGASYAGQATTFAWANQICADDSQERGIVLASMNMWNNVINAWWSIVFYPATDAPKFTKGMYAMIGVAVATLGATALVWVLERRERGRVSSPNGGARSAGVHCSEHGLEKEASSTAENRGDAADRDVKVHVRSSSGQLSSA